MTEHTALPWKYRNGIVVQDNDDATPRAIGNVYPGTDREANARLIVTACNCHADSQKALRELLKWAYWATSQIDSKGPWSEILEAEQAIRKAEEQS